MKFAKHQQLSWFWRCCYRVALASHGSAPGSPTTRRRIGQSVPEPSTLVLLGAAAGVAGARKL